jgi:hypothetical protein
VTADPPANWVAVRDASDVVATVPIPERIVELLDRGTATPVDETDPAEPGVEEPTADEVLVDPESAGPAEAQSEGTDPGDAPDPEPAAPAAPRTAEPGAADQPPAPDAVELRAVDPGATGGPGTVEVVAGDSFWTLAGALAGSGGTADTAEVTIVWSALIDANRDRLVEPGNPDLLHVGQVLVVPTGSS